MPNERPGKRREEERRGKRREEKRERKIWTFLLVGLSPPSRASQKKYDVHKLYVTLEVFFFFFFASLDLLDLF